MKLDRRLDSSTVETPVKFQRYRTNPKPFRRSFDTCLDLFVRHRSVNSEPENRSITTYCRNGEVSQLIAIIWIG